MGCCPRRVSLRSSLSTTTTTLTTSAPTSFPDRSYVYSRSRQGYARGDVALTHSRLVLRVRRLIPGKHGSSLSTVTRSSVVHIESYDGPSSVWRAKLD